MLRDVYYEKYIYNSDLKLYSFLKVTKIVTLKMPNARMKTGVEENTAGSVRLLTLELKCRVTVR